MTYAATMTMTLTGKTTLTVQAETPPAPFESAYYTYDGDDNMVMSVINGVTTYYASSSYVVEVDGSDTTVRKTYSAGSTSLAVRTIVNGTENTLNWMLSDHLGSSSITTTVDGTWNSEIRYSAFGETRYSSGITPTDYRYTGQLEQADVNLYYYNARYYDAALGRFVQSDISIPEVRRTTAYDRYAFVENNPILFVDLNGLEKVIIFYGMYSSDNTDSFEVAAESQKTMAMEEGYDEEDILLVPMDTDVDFFQAIENSDIGEIEQVYIYAHGWGIDYGGEKAGGIRVGDLPEEGDKELYYIRSNDFSGSTLSLENRFANNSEIHINACNVGKGTFPQIMADTFNSTVYAYKNKLKFFESISTRNSTITIPYNGSNGRTFEDSQIRMYPSIGYRNFAIPLSISPKRFTPTRKTSSVSQFGYARIK